MHKEEKGIPEVCGAVSALFETKALMQSASKAEKIDDWNTLILKNLNFDFGSLDHAYQDLTLQCIIKQKSIELPELQDIYAKWTAAMKGGVV